jgi:hypothetical protein
MCKSCLIIAAAVAVTFSLSCGRKGLEQKALLWIECDDCGASELANVVREGNSIVPVFSGYLLNGPPKEAVEKHRVHLEMAYEQMDKESRAKSEQMPLGKKEYVDYYMDSFYELYQVRSAEALGSIGGPEAEAALLSSLNAGDLRQEVREVVKYQLAQAQKR